MFCFSKNGEQEGKSGSDWSFGKEEDIKKGCGTVNVVKVIYSCM
jgi:hypothetical protein